MRHDTLKLCADSLRALAKDQYDIKLKATQAHELVAAYLGYRSKNALLADQEFPVDELAQADFVVMMPGDFVDQRRAKLDGLSPQLPDSLTLGQAVYAALFSCERWGSQIPPFKDFLELAKFLVTSSEQYKAAFPFHRDIPMDHFVIVQGASNAVGLSVVHAHEPQSEESLASGMTKILLPRVAGRIGFGEPKMMPQRWSGDAMQSLKSLGVQL